MDLNNQRMPINIKYFEHELYIPVYSLQGRYYINIDGTKVYSNIYGRTITTQEKKGYYYNNIQKQQRKQGKLFYHRALAEMLLLKRDNRNIINHKDGNTKNNSLNNLEWVFLYENAWHGFGREDYKLDDASHNTLFTKEEVKDIYTSTKSKTELMKDYPKLTGKTLYDIKERRTYKEVTKRLTKGESKVAKRNKRINSITSEVLLRCWFDYMDNIKSVKEISLELDISTDTVREKFRKLSLTIKTNKGKVIMKLF